LDVELGFDCLDPLAERRLLHAQPLGSSRDVAILGNGHELTEDRTPLEANMEWVVKWNKGAFIGREALEKQKQEGLKEQLLAYRQFVKSLVKENRVLEKKFYIIIPFSVIELGLSKSSFNPFQKTPQKPPFDLDYIEEKASMILYPRRDHVIRQFARIGLKASQLTTGELTTLFYSIYNPGSIASLNTTQIKSATGS